MASKPIPHLSQPRWLQSARWVFDPVSYMLDACVHGADCFAAGITGPQGDPVVFVHEPGMLHEIFTHDRRELYSPGDGIAVLEPLIGDSSIVMLERDRHARRRRMLMPPFHGERLQVYADRIAAITIEEAAGLPAETTFAAHRMTQQISLRVIMQSVFGLERGDRYRETRRLLTEVFDSFASPLQSAFLFFPSLQRNWWPWRTFLRRRERLDALIYAEIAERTSMASPPKDDVLSLLMAARDEDGATMTPRELRNELMTLLLAGLETTSTVMAWSLYWIHRQPEVKRRVCDELFNASATTSIAEKARLPYLTAVCNEVLRIHPPVPFTFARLIPEDMDIGGYAFRKGMRVAGCIYLLHHREDLYPRPHEFRPERFLERKHGISEFMPFGAGVRRCIGESLALLEIKVAIATLLAHHAFTLADGRPEKPRRRGVILAPERGVPMRIVAGGSRPPVRPDTVPTSTGENHEAAE